MKLPNKILLEKHAELCSMMANPRRLAIFHLLADGYRSVGEIAKDLDLGVSAVSQQLRLLKDKSLVTSRKEGQTVYYGLKNKRIIDACSIVQEVLLDSLRDDAEMANGLDG